MNHSLHCLNHSIDMLEVKSLTTGSSYFLRHRHGIQLLSIRRKKLTRSVKRHNIIVLMIMVLVCFIVGYLIYCSQRYAKMKRVETFENVLPQIPDNEIQSLSASDMLKVEDRMKLRKNFLTEKCSQFKLNIQRNDIWHKPNPWEFLVNKKYHIIWCNVFKAASSSWLYNFNILAGYSPVFLHSTQKNFVHLARKRYPRVTLEQLHEAQKNSVTFLIVRHPFERLLSAYIDKFMYALPKTLHAKIGRQIAMTYRKKSLRLKPPKYPTFPEFVQWLLDQIKHDSYLDMHFVSYTKFCTPCVINFDAILKFETLEKDQMYLIEKTGLQHIIAPEWQNMGKGKKTLDLVQQFYSNLSRAELDGLYDYYKYDFELFNYSATSYFNMVKPTNAEMPDEAAVNLGQLAAP